MRMVRGSTGEAVDVMRRRRLTDEELRRFRRLSARKMREAGCPIAEIAAIYRISERQVFRDLAETEPSNHARVGRTG
jgi:hypothetical protein